jgi:glycerol kinase
LAPKPGWIEQDPNEILEKTILCMEKAVGQFEGLGYHKSDIKGKRQKQKVNIDFRVYFAIAIGVTNQRETTVLWDKETGKVLYNALVWLDARTQETVDFLLRQYNKHQDCLQVC